MSVKLDSFSSWVVAVSVSLVLTSSVWVFRCSSILFIGIFERFGSSREEAAWPITVFFVSSCFIGPVVGTLSQRFEIRKLFLFATCFNCLAMVLSSFADNIWQLSLTLGLLLGCSAGIPITLGGVYVTAYFDKYRSAGIGVLMSGPSILSIITPSIMQFCLESYQFSGTLLLFAGLCMQGIPAALLLFTIDKPEAKPAKTPAILPAKVPLMEKPSQERIDNNPTTGKRIPIVVLRQLSGNRVRRDTPRLSMDDNVSTVRGSLSHLSVQSVIAKRLVAFHVFKKKWFYIIAVAHVSFIIALSTLLNLWEDFGRDKHLEPVVARNLVGVFAATDLIARLGSPWITDGGYIAREHLFMLNFFLKAVCHSLLGLVNNTIAIFCFVAFSGWLFGSTVVLFVNIMSDRLGAQNLPFASGWYLFLGGLLGLTRPKAIGYFREQVGSYNPILYLLAGLAAAAVIVYLTGYLLERRKTESDLGVIQEFPELEESLDLNRSRTNSYTPSLSSM